MENASKALLMAAGVLIGILILSLAVFLFVDFGSTSAEINRQNAQKQLTQFNTKFTSYEDKEELTIYDVITVAGFANENNVYYENSEEYKITVKINNQEIQNNLDNNYKNLITTYTNNSGEFTYFRCIVTDYHKNGRVSTIIFRPI